MSTDGPTGTGRLIADLRAHVEAVRGRRQMLDFAARLLQSVAIALAAGMTVLVLESVAYFPSSVRTTLVAGCALLLLPSLIVYTVVPLLRRFGILRPASIEDTARSIGAHFPTIRDRLLNALQLGDLDERGAWVSSELIEESVRTLARDLEGLALTDSIDRTGLRNNGRRAGIVAAAVLVLLFAWPGTFLGGLDRLRSYDRDFSPPRTYAISVSPGTMEVAKGTDVTVRITVSARDGSRQRPDAVRVFLRGDGQNDFEPVVVEAGGDGQFTHLLPALRFSYDYYAMAGDERSDEYRISVLDWPSLRSFRVRLDHPAYARLTPAIQEEFAGDIVALPGTRVTVSGRASKELASGSMHFSDSSRTGLQPEGVSFTGSFVIADPMSYSVHVRDTEGLGNRSPIEYQIRVLPDAPPTVAITQPGRNMDIAGGDPIGLFIESSDDYGISSLVLRYRLSHSRYVRPQQDYQAVSVPLPKDTPRDADVSYVWDLGPLDLVPEDVVEYFVEAYDNDTVNGPKSARSAMYTLRLPSLEEVFSDLDTEHEGTLQDLDRTLTEAEELRKDIEKINRDLKTNKDFDWQDQQKAREMAAKVEDIRKRLEKTEQQLKSMTDDMQRQRVLSPETLEKYLELQSMVEQMNTEELQQALREMQQAMEGVRRDQLQQALQTVQFSEERFRQGIERTLNLLKRIQIEQKMDEATRRAQDLADSQEELQNAPPERSTEAARDQERLSGEQQRLEDLLEDLQRRMEEFFTEMPADRLAELNQQLQQQQIDRRMQEASRQMQSGNMQQARQTQQQLQQDLETLSEQLQAMQQQMLEQQTEQVLNSLRRATTDLLELSERQESVKNQAQSSPANSSSLRENAQRQMQIMRELNNVAASLSELAQKSFAVTPGMGRSIGESMQAMQNAMRDLEVRNGSQAAQDQTAAMASLNEAARQVQESLRALMQGAQGSPGGMGLMQQLQMMAGQQMQLNAQTQRLGQGESDLRRAAEAARIAQEQDAVRKSLEQLQREAQSSEDRDRILGDLQQVANDMREVVRNLQQNDVDEQTVRRQERILSRLLDASRSMRERDYEKRREATTGRRFTRRAPDALPTDETRNWLRQEMLKALERGYSRDYQELIRRYFEELERVEARAE